MGKLISQMRQWPSREVRRLPKVTQQVSDWDGAQIQALWIKHTRFRVTALSSRGSYSGEEAVRRGRSRKSSLRGKLSPIPSSLLFTGKVVPVKRLCLNSGGRCQQNFFLKINNGCYLFSTYHMYGRLHLFPVTRHMASKTSLQSITLCQCQGLWDPSPHPPREGARRRCGGLC